MIQFSDVLLKRGYKILLENVNWLISHKQRIGLIGKNGSGKTSILSVLKGELEVEKGIVTISNSLRISCVEQETKAINISALNYILAGNSEYIELQNALTHAQDNHDGLLIAKLHEKLLAIDAYSLPAQAAKIMSGLGFSNADQTKLVSEFSGGWRVRLNLARALIVQSDMLLLDEPTNHLDLEAVIWLENWLSKYSGILILISHDRDFLDKIVNEIVFIHDKKMFFYTGNYSYFEEKRLKDLMLQQASYNKQQRLINHLQLFINRFKAKATKAKQAQSRIKAIEKMEKVCAVQADRSFEFEFKSLEYCPNPLLTLNNIEFGYKDDVLFSNINLTITAGQRMAILGRNGAGKSSLIKLITKDLTPTRGECIFYPGLKIGYFAQQQIDSLSLNDSPYEHLQAIDNSLSEQLIRTYLGGFGFTGDAVFLPIHNFSGGEKSRLALALIIHQRPNLLLLDEPTNHLDLDMRNTLSIALQSYNGSLILISHDRYLLRSNVDQFFILNDGQLISFDGDLEDYQIWLNTVDNSKEISTIKTLTNKKSIRQDAAKKRENLLPILNRIKKIEKLMKMHEDRMKEIADILSKESFYNDGNFEELKLLNQEQGKIKSEIETLEDEWIILSEKIDNLS